MENGPEQDLNKETEQKLIDAADKFPGTPADEPEKNLIPEKDVYSYLNKGEIGDAALFVRLMRGKFCYDHAAAEKEAWHYWNDHYYRVDYLQQVIQSVDEVVKVYAIERNRCKWRIMMAEKDDKPGDVKKQTILMNALSKRIELLCNLKRRNNILSLAGKGIDSLGITGIQWDTKPLLFACKNGIINMETGEFRPGLPEDYIKTVSPTEFKSLKEKCPNWIAFLYDILGEDEEMLRFFQRLLGYSVSGLALERIWPLFYGEHGSNGKGTTLEIMKFVLGDYAQKIKAEFLEQKKGGQQSGHDSELMAFRGKRFVWCSESRKGAMLDMSKLKELTGNDTLSGRAPYGRRDINFTPNHTLFTMTNEQYRILANDPALWDRLIFIKFNRSYVHKPTKSFERQRDLNLMRKLKAEAPGILAWLIRGFRLWQEDGLMIPDTVKGWTDDYRTNEDIIAAYVEECIDIGSVDNISFREKGKDLYASYKNWCQNESGHKAMAKKNFLVDIRRKFGNEVKSNGVNEFRGVLIKTDSGNYQNV